MKIIALGHRAQTGKDTLAGFLMTELRLAKRGMNIQVAGFADEMKDFCYRMYAWAGLKRKEHYESHPEDKKVVLTPLGKTVRDLWIEVGNHMRKYDDDVWVRALLTRPQVDILIVKDMRFPNEAAWVDKLGGFKVKVTRDSAEVLDNVADNALDGYDKWNWMIENDGDKHELMRQAGKLINLAGV
jgi:hypothetical protein